MVALSGCIGPFGSLFIAVFFLKFNEYQLPYNFYLFFLPIDSFLSINWIVNYLVQVVLMFYCVSLFYTYSAFKLLMMNFSCWEIDALALQVKKLFQSGELDGHDDQLRKTVDRSYRVLQWMEQVREIFRVSFLCDFSFASVIFCMCLYTLSFDPFGSVIVYVVFFVIFSQLSIDCWMGSHVDERIERLVNDVYDINWHSVNVNYQKDILMVLIMSQRMKGFNGIFNSVNLETLQKV